MVAVAAAGSFAPDSPVKAHDIHRQSLYMSAGTAVEPMQRSAAGSPETEKEPMRVLEYEPLQPPTLVATGPNSMTLQWKELVLASAEQGSSAVEESEISGLVVTYALQTRLVSFYLAVLFVCWVQMYTREVIQGALVALGDWRNYHFDSSRWQMELHLPGLSASRAGINLRE